jgi:hypothetical protein
MNKYGPKIVSYEITTIYNIQIDHIWTNVLSQQCSFIIIEQIINPYTLQSNYQTIFQNLPYQIIQNNIPHIHDYSNIYYQVVNSTRPTCRDTPCF